MGRRDAEPARGESGSTEAGISRWMRRTAAAPGLPGRLCRRAWLPGIGGKAGRRALLCRSGCGAVRSDSGLVAWAAARDSRGACMCARLASDDRCTDVRVHGRDGHSSASGTRASPLPHLPRRSWTSRQVCASSSCAARWPRPSTCKLVTLDEVEAVLGRGKSGQRSACAPRSTATAPNWRGPRAALEEKFLLLCERHSLTPPDVNVWVAGWLVDAVWFEQKVVVELDSHLGARHAREARERPPPRPRPARRRLHRAALHLAADHAARRSSSSPICAARYVCVLPRAIAISPVRTISTSPNGRTMLSKPSILSARAGHLDRHGAARHVDDPARGRCPRAA